MLALTEAATKRRAGFVNLGLFIPAGNAVTLGVDYRMVNGLSGIDIGGPGFSPSRFPGLQEDAHLVGGRVLINATEVVPVECLQKIRSCRARSRVSAVVAGCEDGGEFDGQVGGRSARYRPAAADCRSAG